jgi:hypothetical protein
MAAIERFLERIFERPGARLFDARVEPVSLAHRIERAIDEERRSGPEGPVAPTRFRLGLHERDLEALARDPGLAPGLGTAALDHARRRGYRIPERPTVELVADPAAAHGTVTIEASFADAAFASLAPVAPRMDRTMVHAAAEPSMPAAVLRVTDPVGRTLVVPIGAHPVAVGRARDNDIALDDPMASRHHARFVPRAGRLLLTDLGSTNGTAVNGRAITEAVLGIGDLIDVGGSRIELLPSDPRAWSARAPVPPQASAAGPDGGGEWPWTD